MKYKTATIIGHRGAAALAIENSMPAFDRAFSTELKWVETDLRVTADNVIVLNHDAFYKGKEISSLSFNELNEISSGNLISFCELLDKYSDKFNFDLDVKDSRVFQLIGKELQRHSLGNQFLMSSFNHAELAKFAILNPIIQCAPIIASRPCSVEAFVNATSFDFDKVIADANFCDSVMVSNFLKAGKQVWLYCIYSKEQADHFIEMGISGIIVDNPNFFLQ